MKNVEEKFVGWNQLLHDRLTRSELAEAKKINYQPTLANKQLSLEDSRGIFVYAANLKPGLHKFVIWDPKVEKAYVKEFVLDLNNEMIACPEYPNIIPPVSTQTKNVWTPWKPDTNDQMVKAIEYDG